MSIIKSGEYVKRKSLMKTATVTWTTYNNCGTILQAYALQQELIKHGYENAILDDSAIIHEQTKRSKEIWKKRRSEEKASANNHSKAYRIVNMLLHPSKLKYALLARTNREQYERPYYASQEAVEAFKKERLFMDPGISLDNLGSANERYDAFIAGSDQVWSVFEDTFNPFFYLDFVTKRKISYAPCLGADRIPESMEQTIRDLLSDYHAVSVRERASADQLESLLGRKVYWTVDPTILRGRRGWMDDIRKIKNPVKRRYLLCYFLENNPWYFEQAKKLAKQLHLRIELIPNRWEYVNSEYVIRSCIGPLEFVSLFANADFVVTDSYHGSIFSILFERRFQYLERFGDNDPNSQNIRIHSLFDALGIGDIIVMRNHEPSCDPKIDWERVGKTVEKMRQDSEQYLIDSLAE